MADWLDHMRGDYKNVGMMDDRQDVKRFLIRLQKDGIITDRQRQAGESFLYSERVVASRNLC